jgi:hypothetical protein
MAWEIKITAIVYSKYCLYRKEIESHSSQENWVECCHPNRSDEDPCECLEEFCPLLSQGDLV